MNAHILTTFPAFACLLGTNPNPNPNPNPAFACLLGTNPNPNPAFACLLGTWTIRLGYESTEEVRGKKMFSDTSWKTIGKDKTIAIELMGHAGSCTLVFSKEFTRK